MWLSHLVFSALGFSGAIGPEQIQREAEVYLANARLDASALSSRLRIWDNGTSEWRTMHADERPQARVLVINLWADYCKPCLEDFPILQKMAQEVEGRYGSGVRFVFLSETNSTEAMAQFVAQNRRQLPSRLYHDTSEAVADVLRQALPSGKLPLPVTLVVDEERRVRHALVGVVPQRSALIEQIRRLATEPRGCP